LVAVLLGSGGASQIGTLGSGGAGLGPAGIFFGTHNLKILASKYRISLQSWQRLLYLKIKPGILMTNRSTPNCAITIAECPPLCQGAGSNSFSSFCLVAITFENSAMTSLPFMSFALISECPGRITNKALRTTAV
jgi:hypothetical protein